MAKISQLPPTLPTSGAEVIPIVQGGVTRRMTLSGLVAAITPSLQQWYKGDKGDPGGNVMSIGLFTAAAALTIPGGTDLVQTSGHGSAGLGHGRYAADPTIDDAYLAAHPLASFRSANGRAFRLVEPGLRPEMFGAVGDGVTNDQPAMQAAFDYSAATNSPRVYLRAPRYLVWATQRTAARYDTTDRSGHPLVVTATLALVSEAGSVIDYRGVGGADPETTYQLVKTSDQSTSNDSVWRGGGIILMGDPAPSDTPTIAYFRMDGVTLQGNRQRTGSPQHPENYQSPGRISDGDGWDESDKGLWLQDSFVGDIILLNGGINGFKGELTYAGGNQSFRDLYIDNFHVHTSNGDALNMLGVSRNVFISRTCRFGDAYQAMEGWGGPGQSFIGGLFYDCATGGTLWGGVLTRTPGTGYNFPTRPTSGYMPLCHVDIVLHNCNQWFPGPWIHGRVHAIDTAVYLDANLYRRLCTINLDIVSTLDGISGIDAVGIGGPVTDTVPAGSADAPAGLYTERPMNVVIRLQCTRSEDAIAHGYRFGRPISWSGLMGEGVHVIIDHNAVSNVPPRVGAGPTDRVDPNNSSSPLIYALGMPRIDFDGSGSGGEVGEYQAVSSTDGGNPTVVLAVSTDIGLYANAGGDYYCAAPTNVADGQRLRLRHADGGGKTFTLPRHGPSMALSTDIKLAASHDYVELRWDARLSVWRDVEIHLYG